MASESVEKSPIPTEAPHGSSDVALFCAAALAFPLRLLAVVRRVRDRTDPTPAPSGEQFSPGAARRAFPAAVLFVVCGLAVALLFAWAVVLHRLALYGLVVILAFAAPLAIGFLFAMRRGALDEP